MSAIATVTSNAVAEWTKIFPRQATETYTCSADFIKQLTLIAVSTITYLKNVLTEDSYSTETFNGIKLRILKKQCTDQLAQFLSDAMAQAFIAFDEKYLHRMAICFYDGDNKVENLVEYHMFEYSYESDAVIMKVETQSRGKDKRSTQYAFDNLRQRTLHMIRACVVIMQTCQMGLPDEYDVVIRLYYNEDAPEGYQAPGFTTAEHEAADHIASTLADCARLGRVDTPFHEIITYSYIKDYFDSSYEAIPSQNTPAVTQIPQEDFNSPVGTSEAGRLRCACNRLSPHDDDGPLVTCRHCGTLQHGACYGLQDDKARRHATHCCVTCSDVDVSRRPTDPRLAELTHKKRECLCLFRRAARWCGARAALRSSLVQQRFTLSAQSAHKLLTLLHSHGVIDLPAAPLNDDTPCKIHHDKLKEVITQFFQPDETNIVERLISQTLSQDSCDDPVGDVLSPMERITLHNDTVLGKVVEPEPMQVVDSETTHEYRRILANVTTNEESLRNQLPVDLEPIGTDQAESQGRRSGKRKIPEQSRAGLRTKRVRVTRDA